MSIIISWICLLTIANVIYLRKYKEMNKCLKFWGDTFKKSKNGITIEEEEGVAFSRKITIVIPHKAFIGRKIYNLSWQKNLIHLLTLIHDIVSTQKDIPTQENK